MTTDTRTRGLSTDRLGRLHRGLAGYVERGYLPGLVALVSRGDDAHVEALGTQTVGGTVPMRRDTIFRIASITKPVTAVAAMILIEECKIRLDDSIEPWLPELANRRVLKDISSELDDTVPATRPITLRHLLTSTMGLGSVMAMPDTYPIQRSIRDYQIGGDGPKLQSQWPTTDQWLQNLGALPLLAQPGERWSYNVSIDVLGALISRVSGQSLGAFMRERIFEPLGMRDTAFWVPPEKIDRLPGFYVFNYETNVFDPFDDLAKSTWSTVPPLESGSGGLVSTVDDYLAFCQMLLNKGRYGGERILAPTSVELMTSDQVTPEQRAGSDVFFGGDASWAFGMAVDIKRDQIYRTPGRFGWDGGFGTSAYTDPVEGVIGILLTQRMIDSPEPPKLYDDFWTLTYQALDD